MVHFYNSLSPKLRSDFLFIMTDEIGRLESIIKSTNDIRQKIDAINTVGWKLRDTDIEKVISLSQETDQLSTTGDFLETPYQKGIADSRRNMGIINRRAGKYYDALSNSLEALSIYQFLGDRRGQIEAYSILGATYDHLGNYPEALVHNLKGLTLSEEIQEYEGTASLTTNIGVIYNKIGEYDKELKMHQQALEIYKRLKNPRGEAITLNNIAIACSALKKYPEALASGIKSLALAKELQLTLFEANVLCTIGEIHLEQNELSQAQAYFKKSLIQAKEIGFRFVELYSLFNIAKSHQKSDKNNKALDYFFQALEIAEEMDEKQIIYQSYQALAEIHKAKQDHKAALEYFEKYHTLEKEIFNESNSLATKNLEIYYQSTAEQREKANEAQFRTLFEDSPISIWEADCTEMKGFFDQLKASGISDLTTYFENYPDEVMNCLGLMKITNVNKEAIKLFQAPDKKTFLAKFKPYIPGAFDVVTKIIIDLAEGKLQQNVFFSSLTFNKNSLLTENFITIAGGYEDTWEKLIVSSIDVTEREKIRHELQKSEARFRTLFEDSPIAIFEQDGAEVKKHLDQIKESGVKDFRKYFLENPDQLYYSYSLLKITKINQAALDLYETEDSNFIMNESKIYIDPDSLESLGGILADLMEGKFRSKGHFISYTLKGKRILLETTTDLLPEHKDTWSKLVASAIDITEQEKAEEELRKSAAQFRMLFEDSPISIFEQDGSELKIYIDKLKETGISDFKTYFNQNPDEVHHAYSLLKVTNVNQATTDLYEAESKDYFLKDFNVYLDPDAVSQMGDMVADFAEGKYNSKIQYSSLTLTGKKIYLEVSSTLTHDYQDNWSKLITSTIDITEQELAKQNLQESEAQFRALFDDSPIAIYEQDASKTKKYIEKLQKSGVTDFGKYFKENPNEVHYCFSLIKITNVNQATVELYEAESKNDYLNNNYVLTLDPESVDAMEMFLIDFIDGKFNATHTYPTHSLKGNKLILETTVSLNLKHQDTWSNIVTSTIDITEREHNRQILIENETKFRTLFEDSPIAIWEADGTLTKEYFNSLKESGVKNFTDYFNKNPDQVHHSLSLLKIRNANKRAIALFQAKDRNEFTEKFKVYITSESFETFKTFVIDLAERKFNHILLTPTITFTKEKIITENYFSIAEEDQDSLRKLIVSTLNVTEREKIRRELQDSEELYRSVSEGANDGISVVDQGIFTYANPRLALILGYEVDEIVGEPMSKFLHPDSFAEIQPLYVRAMGGEQIPPRIEGRAIKKDGTIINVDFNASALDYPPNPRVLIITRDITEQKQLEGQLKHLTITDSLTQISNRRHFFDTATVEHNRATRHGRNLSIILFDLDLFKKVNDTYGHTAGDIVLQKTVRVCEDEIRTTDLIARYGGEEFAVLLPETNLKEAQDLAERLRKKIEKNVVNYNKKKIKVTISAGVAQLDHSLKTSIEELVDQADKALYYSKQNGRNQVNTWDTISSTEK